MGKRRERMKMKKLITLILVVLLISIAFSQDWNKYTLSQIASLLEESAKMGTHEKVVVSVKRKKDVVNFYVDCKDVSGDDGMLEVLGAMVGAIAEVTSKTTWKSDSLFFTDRGRITAWISTRDCREAAKIRNEEEMWDFIFSKLHVLKKRNEASGNQVALAPRNMRVAC